LRMVVPYRQVFEGDLWVWIIWHTRPYHEVVIDMVALAGQHIRRNRESRLAVTAEH
jgi:hypothetical protein